MRKTREEKAITLIALIITIVVLLILAVVTINAVTGDGIIQHATNAKTEYQKAQKEEESILSYYGEYLDAKGDLGPWKQEGNKIYMTNSDEEIIELEIGDTVSYDCYTGVDSSKLEYEEYRVEENDKDMVWKVIGTNQGKILLIATTSTGDTLTLSNKEGYQYGSSKLNSICSIYGHGNGAQSARSINVEDINKVTGYNAKEANWGVGQPNQYGNKITYRVADNKVYYKIGTGTEQTSEKVSFEYFNGNEWVYLGNTEKTFESIYYRYYHENSEIFTSSNGQAYWLDSRYQYTYSGVVVFGIRIVDNLGEIRGNDMYASYGNVLGGTYEVKPVVTLKSTTVLEHDETNDVWKIK